MDKGCKDNDGAIMAHYEAAKVLQPGVGPLNDPSVPVTAQLSAVLMRGYAVVAACRDDRLDALVRQLLANSVAIVSAIGNQPLWLSDQSGFLELLHGRREELDFGGGRRRHVNSERSTLAICQYHKLRSL